MKPTLYFLAYSLIVTESTPTLPYTPFSRTGQRRIFSSSVEIVVWWGWMVFGGFIYIRAHKIRTNLRTCHPDTKRLITTIVSHRGLTLKRKEDKQRWAHYPNHIGTTVTTVSSSAHRHQRLHSAFPAGDTARVLVCNPNDGRPPAVCGSYPAVATQLRSPRQQETNRD